MYQQRAVFLPILCPVSNLGSMVAGGWGPLLLSRQGAQNQPGGARHVPPESSHPQHQQCPQCPDHHPTEAGHLLPLHPMTLLSVVSQFR